MEYLFAIFAVWVAVLCIGIVVGGQIIGAIIKWTIGLIEEKRKERT